MLEKKGRPREDFKGLVPSHLISKVSKQGLDSDLHGEPLPLQIVPVQDARIPVRHSHRHVLLGTLHSSQLYWAESQLPPLETQTEESQQLL